MSSTLRIRVPGSTSNLGPGFDCLGLAVDRYLTLTWSAEGDGAVHATGERPPPGFGDRLAEALSQGSRALGLPRGGSLHVHSEIPVGRGLGSSAALSVALELLRILLRDEMPDIGAVLNHVATVEGHPDNAAPSLHGGLVVTCMRSDGVAVDRLGLSRDIGWVWAAPSVPSDTVAMREALPQVVPHQAAVRNAGRLARLLPALAAGDGAALCWAMEDELHVPWRLPLIAGGEAARRAALEAGAWACTISGAGSGLIAAVPHAAAPKVVEAMAEAFRRVDPSPDLVPAYPLTPDLEGARWGVGL